MPRLRDGNFFSRDCIGMPIVGVFFAGPLQLLLSFLKDFVLNFEIL